VVVVVVMRGVKGACGSEVLEIVLREGVSKLKKKNKKKIRNLENCCFLVQILGHNLIEKKLGIVSLLLINYYSYKKTY
jgi:hypothetical protein